MIINTVIQQCFNCNSNEYKKLSEAKDYCYQTVENNFTYVECNNCQNIYLLKITLR